MADTDQKQAGENEGTREPGTAVAIVPAGGEPGTGHDAGQDRDSEAGAGDAGDRERDILGLMHSDPRAYEEAQPELQGLIANRLAREASTAHGKPQFTADDLAQIENADADIEADASLAEVPESADGYMVPAPPQDLGERSEFDAELIGDALQMFHAHGFTKGQVATTIKAFDAAQMKAAKAREEAANERQAEAVKTLREVYVHDYEKNVDLANGLFRQYLSEYLPEQKDRQALLSMRLEDGTMLGSYPPFVQALVDLARAAGRKPGDPPPPRRQPLDGMSDADLAREHRRIMALMYSDEAAYQREQPRLIQVITAMNRRKR